jgi:anthranilate phosphoribosyltransferase
MKGESSEEIAGLARVMRMKATQVNVHGPVLDVVGTGGDGLNTLNISTGAALVAAGAGLKVAKHGNRAASSKCGSADVLEKLGVKIELDANGVERCIEEAGIGFMFAQTFHPAMKHAGGARREIGIRTVFNILGPLTNPAHAEHQVIGTAGTRIAENIYGALLKLQIRHAIVACGLNGMDEISPSGKSVYWEVKDGEGCVRGKEISPEDFDCDEAPLDSVAGGTAEQNADSLRGVLGGERGPKRDAVVMNAAAALVAGNRVASLPEGATLARKVIDEGKAMGKLEALIKVSNE